MGFGRFALLSASIFDFSITAVNGCLARLSRNPTVLQGGERLCVPTKFCRCIANRGNAHVCSGDAVRHAGAQIHRL
eukprot:7387221-Prymnesium_polylepis.1